MNKAWFGLLLGGFLGIFDGLSALVSAPEVRPQIAGIVIGSTFKGVLAGVLIGYFARKVRSLPLGIVFGLTVGLALAFAVAAMPNPAGRHYYWEIMLPGGILGVIVGYATQRHAERRAGVVAAVLLALLALGGTPGMAEVPAEVPAEAPAKLAAKAAFARLKTLAGEWQGPTSDNTPATVRYQVSSGGSTVIETAFPGSDHEMVSVYYLENGDLVLTHYCSAGNQPHMRYDPAASTADSLVFAFAGGTSFDPRKDGHIHSGSISFKGDKLENEWSFFIEGKLGNSKKFMLGRK